MNAGKIYSVEEKKKFKMDISWDYEAEDPTKDLPKTIHYALFYTDYGLARNFEIDEYEEEAEYFLFKRFRKSVLKSGEYVFLPVYIHQHSYIQLSFEPFHDPYESWLLGYIWYNKNEAMEEQGLGEDELLKSVKAKAEEYFRIINGEVFCYEILDNEGMRLEYRGGYDEYEKAEADGLKALERVRKAAPEQMELFAF